jgi:transposase
MSERAAGLRRRVRATGPRRRGAKLDAGLRAEIAAYARERREAGDGVRAIAASVGLSSESIRRWTSGVTTSGVKWTGAKRRALVPVVVRERAEVSEHSVVLTSPCGYRVDGLTIETAAELLRRLA